MHLCFGDSSGMCFYCGYLVYFLKKLIHSCFQDGFFCKVHNILREHEDLCKTDVSKELVGTLAAYNNRTNVSTGFFWQMWDVWGQMFGVSYSFFTQMRCDFSSLRFIVKRCYTGWKKQARRSNFPNFWKTSSTVSRRQSSVGSKISSKNLIFAF